MKRVSHLLAATILTAGAVMTQAAQPPTPPPGAQLPAGGRGGGQKLSLAQSLQNQYNNIKRNLTESVAKLPEGDVGFKVGSMPETRPFGALFGHVANAQFNTCAALKGVPNPNQGVNNEEKKTKAEIQRALNDSFAFCDDAVAALNDSNVLETIKAGNNEVTRAAAVAGMISHSNEMYGTAAAYFRTRGLVPPSTERAGQRGRGMF